MLHSNNLLFILKNKKIKFMFSLKFFILSTFLKSDLEVDLWARTCILANFSKDELEAKLSQDHLFLLYVAVILSLEH